MGNVLCFITSIILFLPTLKQLHTKGPSLLVADIGIPASKAFRCKALKRSRLKRLATQSRSGNKSGGAIYRLAITMPSFKITLWLSCEEISSMLNHSKVSSANGKSFSDSFEYREKFGGLQVHNDWFSPF